MKLLQNNLKNYRTSQNIMTKKNEKRIICILYPLIICLKKNSHFPHVPMPVLYY